MSILKQKEKNLNILIDKLNSLNSTYSQPPYEFEKIKTEKNQLLEQKLEVEKKKSRINEGAQIFERESGKSSRGS